MYVFIILLTKPKKYGTMVEIGQGGSMWTTYEYSTTSIDAINSRKSYKYTTRQVVKSACTGFIGTPIGEYMMTCTEYLGESQVNFRIIMHELKRDNDTLHDFLKEPVSGDEKILLALEHGVKLLCPKEE